MSERFISGRKLTHHFNHPYIGLFGEPAQCHIGIFQGAGLIPVVIAAQLPEHEGSTMTAMQDYIAAEVLIRYLPERVDEEIPVIWVEYYPHDEDWSVRRLAEREIIEELPTWSLIPFPSAAPKVSYLHVKRIKIESAENEDYTITRIPLSKEEVASLIGFGKK